MSVTVGEIRDLLDRAYPPQLAEDWDRVGLICGDPAAPVDRVAVALDCTDAVAEAAIGAGAQLLVVHHPLLLRGVSSVAADTPKGRILHRLIRAGVALFAAHTNADSARPGVNDALAELLGVRPGRPLAPTPDPGLDLWAVKVPAEEADAVAAALFDAGAGAIGDYDRCRFDTAGTGRFRPGAGARPHIGAAGVEEAVAETKLELVAPRPARARVLAALRAAHPYEEPAFDIIESAAPAVDPDRATGLGRIGELDRPMAFRDFVARVAERLPATEWGVRGAGDPDRRIRTVAVASGSGDSFLGAAAAAGVDAFVTSDLRHHPVDEALRAGGPCIVDTAHWASESPWCAAAAALIAERAGVAAEVLDIRTDPWTLAAGGRGRAPERDATGDGGPRR